MNQQLSNIALLSAGAATGAGKVTQFSGRYCFAVVGSFDGATVGLQMLGPDDATWIAVKDAVGAIAFTSADASLVFLPAGTYRATIAGGGAPSITAVLKRIID